MSIKGDVLVIGGGIVLVAMAAWWAKRTLTGGVDAAVDWAADHVKYVNPASPDNIVYGGVNSAGASMTGDKNFTLGGYLYDLVHPAPTPTRAPDFGVINPTTWD